MPALTGSVRDALRLGCSAVGFTIYPGSCHCRAMYQQLREIAEEAKQCGLAVVVWSYPRGSGLSKAGETAVDVVAYASQIAAQLGAHLIKVKPPSDHLELDSAKKVYESTHIPIKTLTERVRHVVQSAFAGHRMVIFSGVDPSMTTPPSSMRFEPFAMVERLVPSLDAIPFNGQKPRRFNSSTPSWEFTLERFPDAD